MPFLPLLLPVRSVKRNVAAVMLTVTKQNMHDWTKTIGPIEVTPAMIEAGVGVDCDYAVKDEADESERIRDIFLAMMAVRQEDIFD